MSPEILKDDDAGRRARVGAGRAWRRARRDRAVAAVAGRRPPDRLAGRRPSGEVPVEARANDGFVDTERR